jgi:hypothetical protein
MRNGALIVVALAGILVALVFWRRDPHTRPTTTALDAPIAAATTAITPAPTLTPDVQPAEDDVPAPAPYPTDPDTDRKIAAAHHELITAAVPCYRNRAHRPVQGDPAAPDETMQELRVGYQIVIAGGKAIVTDVTPADPANPADTLGTPLQDEDLARCIVDAIAIAEWTTTDADETIRVEDTIVIGELDRPAPTSSPKPTTAPPGMPAPGTRAP